jgi:hypothetical protein
MQKKIAAYLGLPFFVLVVTVLTVRWLPPTEPPLRVGMTHEEVRHLMGDDSISIPVGNGFDPELYVTGYSTEVDWLGNSQFVDVWTDRNWIVVSLEVKQLPRTRPPWLDRTAKWVGW